MKCAVNAPVWYPFLNIGSYVYGLAHECTEKPHYQWDLKTDSRFTILDNGADELGEGMSGADLYDLMLWIEPEELILPDVLGNKEQTIENSTKFHKDFLSKKTRPDSLMAVPQGLTYDDWITCYNHFLKWDEVDVLGIPYDIEFDIPGREVREGLTKTEKRARRRLALVKFLDEWDQLRKPLHLLGMNNLWELGNYDRFESVRSTDTTAPFAAAIAGRKWSTNLSGEKDWPALDFNSRVEEDTMELILNNLYEYAKTCGDLEAMYRVGKVVGAREGANV